MTYTLILTDTPIIVSDEVIKDGDFRYEPSENEWYKTTNSDFEDQREQWFKVIAGLPHQPSIDFSLVQQWAEEHGIVDVDGLAKEYLEKTYPLNTEHPMSDEYARQEVLIDYTAGFNTHKSLSGKRYSEEDLFECLEWVQDNYMTNGICGDWWKNSKQYGSKELIKIWQQLSRKSFNVELEMEAYTVGEMGKLPLGTVNSKPKITNNAVKITKIL